MPRRSLVLLVLVILAGLWTPPQGTQAQAGCPEGGCKVYLPLIPVPAYVRVTQWGWYADFGRYIWCENPTVIIEFRNVSNEVVTGLSIHVRGALGDGTDASYDATLANIVLLPGEHTGFAYPLIPDTPEACDYPYVNSTFDAEISITNVVLDQTQD